MAGLLCFTAVFAIVFLGIAWRIIGAIRPRSRSKPLQQPHSSNASTKNPRSGTLADSAANDYAALLRDAVNTSADPCNNFYQFACGSWTQRHPKTSSRSENLYIFIESALLRMREVNAISMEREPIGKAARYIEACLAPREDTAISDLKTVLAEAGLTWPERSESADFLPALFFMARRVALPVFFGVDLLQRQGDGGRTLAFFLDLTFQEILRRVKQLITTLHAAAYIRIACQNMLGNEVNDTRLYEILEGLVGATDVFEVYLLATAKEEVINNITFVFRIAPSVTESKWKTVLREYLNTSTTDIAAVRVFDFRSLEAILRLVDTRGEASAKDILGFLAVQAAIFYSSVEMRESFFGSLQEATIQQQRYCFRDTYRLFRPIVNNFLLKTSNEALKEITTIITNVTDAFLSLLNKSTWNGPLNRFDEMTIRSVLTLEDKSDDTGADHEAYPKMSASALLNRLSVAGKLALSGIAADETADSDNIGARRQFDFNSDFVATYKNFTLTPYRLYFPWYSSSAPRSILYAGIGARIAATLFYTCIERSSTCRAIVYENLGCLASGGGAVEHQAMRGELQAAVAGIGVAWRAFEESVQKEIDRDTVIAADSSTSLSSRAAFFAFGCYLFCGEKEGEDICNAPLKRSASFARVFDCARGSPMNSERKCDVLA